MSRGTRGVARGAVTMACGTRNGGSRARARVEGPQGGHESRDKDACSHAHGRALHSMECVIGGALF